VQLAIRVVDLANDKQCFIGHTTAKIFSYLPTFNPIC
jgi:hypothetical protein